MQYTQCCLGYFLRCNHLSYAFIPLLSLLPYMVIRWREPYDRMDLAIELYPRQCRVIGRYGTSYTVEMAA